MTMKKRLATLALAACGLFALATPSHAAQTSWEYQSVGMLTTNWNQTLTLNKFDTSLGTLTGVEFSLEGSILGDIKVESLDAAASTITATLQAILTLKSPTNAVLTTLTPSVSESVALSAFDGVIDFGGTSGHIFAGLSDASGPVYANDNANLSSYNGPGTFTVALNAAGMSTASGGGNLVTQFATQAAGKVGVRYTYDAATPAVPEPTSLALLGVGSAFGLAYRRRRNLNASR